MLQPPWTDEKPKAFSAFVTKKYGVSTYQPTCLSAVSEAELEGTVAQQMEVYETVPVAQTGWTYASASPGAPAVNNHPKVTHLYHLKLPHWV